MPALPIASAALPLSFRIMSIADLIFTGFNKRVAALHREMGHIVWEWKAPAGMAYTTLLLDGDRLIVSVQGYTYSLDALTGRQLWANDLPGFGTGVASLASVRGASSVPAAQAALISLAGAADSTAAATAAAAPSIGAG